MPDVLAVEVAAELAEEATAELEKETADEKDSFNHNHALHVVHREDSPTSQPSHPSKKWNPKHTEDLYKKAKEYDDKKKTAAEKQADGCTFQPSTTFVMEKGVIKPSKEAPKPTTPGSEKRYKQLYESAKKRQQARDEKTKELAGTDKDCTFTPNTTYVMNKGKLEASKESPKPDSTPSSEKRYEVLYQAAVKKQKERDEKIQEFAGTDKECTFKPALVHQMKKGKVMASPDAVIATRTGVTASSDVVSRLYNPDHNLEQELERSMLKEEVELEGCTFMPQISYTPATSLDSEFDSPVEGGTGMGTGRRGKRKQHAKQAETFSRLYEDAFLAEQRKAALKEEYEIEEADRTCTFAPDISMTCPDSLFGPDAYAKGHGRGEVHERLFHSAEEMRRSRDLLVRHAQKATSSFRPKINRQSKKLIKRITTTSPPSSSSSSSSSSPGKGKEGKGGKDRKPRRSRKPPPVHERLYAQSKRQADRRDKLFQEREIAKAAQAMAACTFKPQVNAYKSPLASEREHEREREGGEGYYNDGGNSSPGGGRSPVRRSIHRTRAELQAELDEENGGEQFTPLVIQQNSFASSLRSETGPSYGASSNNSRSTPASASPRSKIPTPKSGSSSRSPQRRMSGSSSGNMREKPVGNNGRGWQTNGNGYGQRNQIEAMPPPPPPPMSELEDDSSDGETVMV